MSAVSGDPRTKPVVHSHQNNKLADYRARLAARLLPPTVACKTSKAESSWKRPVAKPESMTIQRNIYGKGLFARLTDCLSA